MKNELLKTEIIKLVENENLSKEDSKILFNLESGTISGIKLLSEVTKEKADQHDFKAVKKCFIIADNLLSEGNLYVKNMICNVYLFSLSYLLDRKNEFSEVIENLLPENLKNAYINQVYHSFP